MDKRYQVFVSSTYEDLQEERKEVMHALLELDCIPAGMELFPAANDDQWTLIKKVIDDCDYYLVIIGGRYGSRGPDGMGYTEKEYRYALEADKPIIGFVHKDPDSLPAKKTEKKLEEQELLLKFRELVQQKMCKFWSSPAELGSVVSRSLIRLIKTAPGIGWVRGDVVTDAAATEEILQLRKQLDTLEKELSAAQTEAPPGTEDFAQASDEILLHYGFSAYNSRTYDRTSWTGQFSTTWDEIFSVVSPLMIHESDEKALKFALDTLSKTKNIDRLRENEELKGHSLSNFSITQDDFQTIKVQLRALGLITKSIRPRSVKDTETYWSLTPYGDSHMVRLRAIRRTDIKPKKARAPRKKKKKANK